MSNMKNSNINNFLQKDKIEYSTKYDIFDQSIHSNIDYYSMSSDDSKIYYSDSEGSKLLILPRQKKFLHFPFMSNSSDSENENNCSMIDYKFPLATSSPLQKTYVEKNENYYKTSSKRHIKKKKSKYSIDSESSKPKKHKDSKKAFLHSEYHTPCNDYNLLNKSLLKYSNILITANQEKKHISYMTKRRSQICCNDVMTNILNFKQLPINLQKFDFIKNTDNKDNDSPLKLLSDEVLNSHLINTTNMSEIQLDKISHGHPIINGNDIIKCDIKEDNICYTNSSITSNDLFITRKHMKYNENLWNNNDLSEFFQMKLSLNMFPGNIVPYLNSLKHDILQLINNCMYESDKIKTRVSKNVNDTIKNIHSIMKSSMNTCCSTIYNENTIVTVSFVTIDLNSLNVLNNNLENVNKILELVKLTLNDDINYAKLTEKIDLQNHNEFLKYNHSSFIEELKLIEPSDKDVISSTKTEAFDSFNHIRELNKSNTLLIPTNNNIVSHESCQEESIENHNLKYVVEMPNREISEILTPDINLSYKNIDIDIQSSSNKSYRCSAKVKNNNNNPYWLRNKPKSTTRFTAPFKHTSIKRKPSRIKTNYNDVFICNGTGKNKKILQYKVHSVLNANSSELIKKLCPENNNSKNKNSMYNENIINPNVTFFDLPNLKPKSYKPCCCGIFPSQVPTSWNNSLHKSLHQNLYKLDLKSQSSINIVNKINDNGLIYDIIKFTENCNNDKDLKLTLKNVQYFINIEIDFSKKNIESINHSIFLAVNPNSKIIGYLETEILKNACIYENNNISENLIAVKFGVSKLWVMVKYRNNGVATKLLKQFCDEENLKINEIAFAYHGNHGISFIKKFFANNAILIY